MKILITFFLAVISFGVGPIFVYCRSGRRSAQAAEILAGLGYRNIFDLGGLNDWPYETVAGE